VSEWAKHLAYNLHAPLPGDETAAAMWDGSDDSEPLGWNKNGQTREWRESGSSETWQAGRAVSTMVTMANAENAWPPKI
jgi:hypothetical protein